MDELEFVFFLLFINVTEERHVVPFDFLYKSFFWTPMALHKYRFTTWRTTFLSSGSGGVEENVALLQPSFPQSDKKDLSAPLATERRAPSR